MASHEKSRNCSSHSVIFGNDFKDEISCSLGRAEAGTGEVLPTRLSL